MPEGLVSTAQLLDEPQFRCITKIKTIGSTYMAASGVTPDANANGYSAKVRGPCGVGTAGEGWTGLTRAALAEGDPLG